MESLRCSMPTECECTTLRGPAAATVTRLLRAPLHRQEAEDLVQDAMVALVAEPGQRRSPRKREPWIRTVARNRALRSLRVGTRRPLSLDSGGSDGGPIDVPAEESCSGETTGRRAPCVAWFQRHLRLRLCERQRQVLDGTLNGLRPGEVGQRLGIDAHDVRFHWRRLVAHGRRLFSGVPLSPC